MASFYSCYLQLPCSAQNHKYNLQTAYSFVSHLNTLESELILKENYCLLVIPFEQPVPHSYGILECIKEYYSLLNSYMKHYLINFVILIPQSKFQNETEYLNEIYSQFNVKEWIMFSEDKNLSTLLKFSYTLKQLPLTPLSQLDIEAYPFDNSSKEDNFEKYEQVVLGGTFDRLHVGHKLMFTQLCYICSNQRSSTLHVGISADELLVNKKYKELIEIFETRKKNVQLLLQLLKPNINQNLFALHDPYGPTITDSQLQCIVLTEENIKSIDSINAKRREMHLAELHHVCVHLVVPKNASATKLSSTEWRARDAKYAL